MRRKLYDSQTAAIDSEAIANYQKALELNPKNGNAVLRLQKLK